MQGLHEMHKILGQVDILGSPIVLSNSLIVGLTRFIAEPAKARNPQEFMRGVVQGSVIFVKMFSYGFLTFFGQVGPSFAVCVPARLRVRRRTCPQYYDALLV